MSWQKVVVTILVRAVLNATPEIRSIISGYLAELQQKAKATENPWDDLLVGILTAVFEGVG